MMSADIFICKLAHAIQLKWTFLTLKWAVFCQKILSDFSKIALNIMQLWEFCSKILTPIKSIRLIKINLSVWEAFSDNSYLFFCVHLVERVIKVEKPWFWIHSNFDFFFELHSSNLNFDFGRIWFLWPNSIKFDLKFIRIRPKLTNLGKFLTK